MEPDLDNDVTVPLVDLPSARPDASEAQHPGESQSLRESQEGHESLQMRLVSSAESQDAADLTSRPSPIESNPRRSSLTEAQSSHALESVGEVERRHGAPRRYTRTILASLVTFLIPVLVITCFSIWVFYAFKHKVIISGDATGVFGSKLSQPQAKAFESTWNALISPLIFFLLDAFWFSVARVTMISEKSSGMIALRPLTAASSTDAGTYNLVKIYKIVWKARLKMIPFATLVVLSGVALAAVANVVAYEAYTDVAGGTSVRIQTLNGNQSHLVSISEPSQFSTQQLANFTGQTNGMLTALSYQNAEDKLESDSYIGVNATRASLNALSIEIMRLYNVPGYRLSIGCQAQPPDSFGATQMGGFYVSISPIFSDRYNLQALYPGQLATMGDEHNDPFTFVGFAADKRQLYLGCALCFKGSTQQTPYGNITYKTFEMPQKEFVGTKKSQSVYGLRCKVTRQTGWHNFTREKDLSWKRTTSSWDGLKVDTPLLIADWQVALNFHGPSNPTRAGIGLEPGIGPAFWASARIANSGADYPATIDYRILALNFLYAAGETERMSYEVQSAAQIGENKGTFEVQATKSAIFYKLTYVPALLMVGLLGILCAFIICSVMVCIKWRSQSFKQWRKVDSLRLLVDAVDGLRDEPNMRNIQDASNEKLSQWGKGFNVRYVKSADDDRIVLQH